MFLKFKLRLISSLKRSNYFVIEFQLILHKN